MGNNKNIYLVFTLEDCLKSLSNKPPAPLAIVHSYSKVGAQAALYAAIKDGEIEREVNIEGCHYLDITSCKELISHEEYEYHTV